MFFDLDLKPCDHQKRTATVSFRCPPEQEARLQAIANAAGVTLSDLLCHLSSDYCERWSCAYHKLKQAFEANPDLPGRPESNHE